MENCEIKKKLINTQKNSFWYLYYQEKKKSWIRSRRKIYGDSTWKFHWEKCVQLSKIPPSPASNDLTNDP